MANIITWLKDRKKENIIVPKTLTKAVYDDGGVALDQIILDIKNITADSVLYRPELVTGEYTYFACDWSKYKLLIFTPMYYSNRYNSTVMRTEDFSTLTSSNNRLILYFGEGATTLMQVYAVSDGVMIYSSQAYPHSIAIVGIN